MSGERRWRQRRTAPLPALVVDARAIWRSGIGRYTREIAARLVRRERFREVMLVGDDLELRRWGNAERLPVGMRIIPLAGGRYSVFSQVGWTRISAMLPTDAVVWFPHWDAPLLYMGPPSVVTVHDLIQLRVPGVASGVKRFAMRALLRAVTRRASTVITDAAFTQRDLLALEPRLASVQVVPCGVADRFLLSAESDETLPPRVRAPFVLCVANRKPHKNLAAAVEVVARLRRSDPSLTLVVVGEHFPEWASVLSHAASLGVGDAIVDLANVSDAQLAALYRACDCLLFPSRYEGFGLPVLEAMACGAPVVASNTTTIPEVAGDAAILVPPDDVEAMAAAVQRVRSDLSLRSGMIERGRTRAHAFTWDRAAEQVEAILLSARA